MTDETASRSAIEERIKEGGKWLADYLNVPGVGSAKWGYLCEAAAEYLHGHFKDVPASIDMLLFCPRCQHKHIDAPEPATGWTNPPHATHTCKFCGLNWRPSNTLTNGVDMIEVQEPKHSERIVATDPLEHANRSSTPPASEQGTPRTDAVCSTNDIPRLGYGHPLADLARQLERELAEAEAELERRQAKIMRLTSPSSSSVACVSDEQLQDTYATVCAEQGHMAGLRAIVQRSTGRTPETPRWTDAAEAAFEKWWQSWREANGYANTQRMRETARAVYVEIAYSPITAAMEKLAAEGNLEIANRSTETSPLTAWAEQVRLTIRGIDLQAERLTECEQTTFRDGENQTPVDEDFEDVIVGYKLNTGLWHRLLGLLATIPSASVAREEKS